MTQLKQPYTRSGLIIASGAFVVSLFTAVYISRAEMLPPRVVAHTSIFGGGEAQKRGAKVFSDTGCAHCHGPNGIGGGRGPDLGDVGHRLKKDQIRLQIEHGGNIMPAYATILNGDQISDLVAYLSTHRDRSHHVSPTTPPPVQIE